MRRALPALASLCLAVLTARADSITQTVFSGPFTVSYPGQDFQLQFAGFNPAAGTLTSVSIGVSGSYTIVNTGAQSYAGKAAFNDQLSSNPGETGTIFVPGAYHYQSTTGTYTISDSATDQNADQLAYFTSTGTVSPYLFLGDDLNAVDKNATPNGLAVSVTYNYQAAAASTLTPEPSSLLMLGTGVLGVIGAVRRRPA